MSLPAHNPDLAVQETDDGLLLLKNDGSYIVVNRTGLLIWNLLKTRCEEEELVDTVCRKVPRAEKEVIQRDVTHFIEQLLERGFLVERP